MAAGEKPLKKKKLEEKPEKEKPRRKLSDGMLDLRWTTQA